MLPQRFSSSQRILNQSFLYWKPSTNNAIIINSTKLNNNTPVMKGNSFNEIRVDFLIGRYNVIIK